MKVFRYIWWTVVAWPSYLFVPRTGRADYRSFWWRWLQTCVLKRDGWRCRKCGEEPKYGTGNWLEAHHKKEVAQGGRNRMYNLVTLCKICHKEEHQDA